MADRFKELILYLAQKSECDPTFGAVKLNKLLFFCDFLAFRALGHPISGQHYVKREFGPCARDIVPALTQLQQEGACLEHERLHFGFKQKRVLALRPAAVAETFAPEEVELIDDVLRELWDNNAQEVSQLSHTFIGWRAAGDREEIPYETVFLGDPQNFTPTEQEVEYGQRLAQELGAG